MSESVAAISWHCYASLLPGPSFVPHPHVWGASLCVNITLVSLWDCELLFYSTLSYSALGSPPPPCVVTQHYTPSAFHSLVVLLEGTLTHKPTTYLDSLKKVLKGNTAITVVFLHHSSHLDAWIFLIDYPTWKRVFLPLSKHWKALNTQRFTA